MSAPGQLGDRFVPWRKRFPSAWRISTVKYSTRMNAEVLSEATPPTYAFDYLDIGNVGEDGAVVHLI